MRTDTKRLRTQAVADASFPDETSVSDGTTIPVPQGFDRLELRLSYHTDSANPYLQFIVMWWDETMKQWLAHPSDALTVDVQIGIIADFPIRGTQAAVYIMNMEVDSEGSLDLCYCLVRDRGF